MKTIYEVVDNGVDGWAHHSVGFFESEEDAVRVRDKETSYGQGSINKHEVFESLGSYEAFQKESALNRAKSKLTEQEQKLLDIK